MFLIHTDILQVVNIYLTRTYTLQKTTQVDIECNHPKASSDYSFTHAFPHVCMNPWIHLYTCIHVFAPLSSGYHANQGGCTDEIQFLPSRRSQSSPNGKDRGGVQQL